MSTELFTPFVPRSGRLLRNRIAKAAMEENMAGREQLPDERLFSLYRRWVPVAVTPDLPDRWRAGEQPAGQLRPVTWSDNTLASAASVALVRRQLRRIARGRNPALGTHPVHALACDQLAQRRALRRYRSWLQAAAHLESQ